MINILGTIIFTTIIGIGWLDSRSSLNLYRKYTSLSVPVSAHDRLQRTHAAVKIRRSRQRRHSRPSRLVPKPRTHAEGTTQAHAVALVGALLTVVPRPGPP
jgi:hypothetical protein